MVPINHVGPTLAQRDTWKRMVGITLAYAGLVGLRTLDQHRTNRWQLCRHDDQNDIGLTSFVDVEPKKLPTKCQRWPYMIAIWVPASTGAVSLYTGSWWNRKELHYPKNIDGGEGGWKRVASPQKYGRRGEGTKRVASPKNINGGESCLYRNDSVRQGDPNYWFFSYILYLFCYTNLSYYHKI